ncbi:hypothetical protein LJR009_001572 [Bosea sp. LjRoot9]|uniref:hypothetical protein n=1 Tax=Bosea sp. LjRoot9 TaxID=3342341 RepID=UPI003ECE3018
MIGTKLTAQEVLRVIHSGGNFTLSRIDLPTVRGQARQVAFEPPYALESGRDYAFHTPSGADDPELWEVEQNHGGWTWSRRARRSGEVGDDAATRH